MSEEAESMERVARQVRIALETADLSAFGDILDPNVRWGAPGDPSPPCQSREQVVSWYQRGEDVGARARVSETTVFGDRILFGLVVAGTRAARERGGKATRWQVLTVKDGRVVDIVGFEQRSGAVAHAAVPAE
jgi:ketosteroid isomerase-like protein